MSLRANHFHATLLTLLLCACMSMQVVQAQGRPVPDFPPSSMADEGCIPCYDTVRILMLKKVFDLGFLLPEWNPVVDWDHVETVEGIVVPVDSNYFGNHVSQEDFSAYHYTHDFGFNVQPTAATRRVLARRIYTGHEIHAPGNEPDTVIDHSIHVEWESGLAIDSKDNPCAEANRRGESCGFFSAGHKKGETIWNWPSVNDWVHCEGTWIWDRGHPPARTELHPLRLCAIHRNLPSFVPMSPGGADSVIVGRIDLFASGDGGALHNNRPDRAPFAHAVRMSDRDYHIVVAAKHMHAPLLVGDERKLRAPRLFYRVEARSGDSYTGTLGVRVESDSIHIDIPWRKLPDTQVLARSLYYWWEGADDAQVQAYDVTIKDVYFVQRKDVTSRPERVLWLDVAGQYFCVNELLDGDNIFKDGIAQSYQRSWPINKTFRIYTTADEVFRIHVGGWESDGISRVFGQLLDPDAPCNKATKKAFHRHLWPATPFGLHGCLDDLIGEVHDMIRATDLGPDSLFVSTSFGRENELEQCPGANTEQNNVFRVRYGIRRVERP